MGTIGISLQFYLIWLFHVILINNFQFVKRNLTACWLNSPPPKEKKLC